MKIRCCSFSFAVALLAAQGPAAAIRTVGDLPEPRPAAGRALPQASQTVDGAISRIRATDPKGTEIEINGRWWLVLPGRTALLRDGLPVDVRTLAVGQAVRYAPATTTPGERALGIVHVP